MPHLQLSDIDLHYDESGDPGNEQVLVLTHPFPLDSRSFRKTLAHYASRFHCIAVDLRGAGRSIDSHKRVISMEQQGDTLLELFDKLNISQVHYVGAAMGGVVGLRAVLKDPSRFRSLTLVCSRADSPSPEEHKEFRKMLLIARLFGLKPLANRLMRIFFGPSFLNDPARKDEVNMWRQAFKEQGRLVYWQAKGLTEMTDVRPQISKISCPTLIISAADDGIAGTEAALKMRQRIAGSMHREIKGSGHMAFVEIPNVVHEHMDAFFKSLDL